MKNIGVIVEKMKLGDMPLSWTHDMFHEIYEARLVYAEQDRVMVARAHHSVSLIVRRTKSAIFLQLWESHRPLPLKNIEPSIDTEVASMRRQVEGSVSRSVETNVQLTVPFNNDIIFISLTQDINSLP